MIPQLDDQGSLNIGELSHLVKNNHTSELDTIYHTKLNQIENHYFLRKLHIVLTKLNIVVIREIIYILLSLVYLVEDYCLQVDGRDICSHQQPDINCNPNIIGTTAHSSFRPHSRKFV